jgi:nucleotide-binding universal stress UspA family protein
MLRSEVIAMSDGFVLVGLIGGCWLTIGLVLSIVMGRRGHDSFGWLVLGSVLGPLAAVLAVDARRNDEHLFPLRLVRGSRESFRGRGPVDVLVGYDGSPQSVAALDAAVELLGERLGRVTAATVVPYDHLPEVERLASKQLGRLAERPGAVTPDLKLLRGHPSLALCEYAVDSGYELIVVGTRGTGITKAILGSAASELARDSTVPVLLVGADREAA